MSRVPRKFFVSMLSLIIAVIIGGCGNNQPVQQVNPTAVKVIPVLKTDAPISYEYSGQIIGKGEVKVQSKLAGKITEKYITGGQSVVEGQALYKVDSRQYEAAVLQAKANLAKAQTNLNNAQIELERDQMLFKQGAIAEQILTNQQAAVNAQRSDLVANRAMLTKAEEDLADTVVYAPISGRLGIDDVAVGSYVTPGNTVLVTINSVDPIFAQFSISETEYLRFTNAERTLGRRTAGKPIISMALADGSIYPYKGRFGEADSGLSDNTGTLTLRVLFDNPDNILVSGMFARIIISGMLIPNALLVPERAIQQLLGESFVLVANAENKSEMRKVTLGEKVGSYYVVTDGLNDNDMVVVEGLSRLSSGIPLNVTVVSADEMGFSLKENNALFNSDK